LNSFFIYGNSKIIFLLILLYDCLWYLNDLICSFIVSFKLSLTNFSLFSNFTSIDLFNDSIKFKFLSLFNDRFSNLFWICSANWINNSKSSSLVANSIEDSNNSLASSTLLKFSANLAFV